MASSTQGSLAPLKRFLAIFLLVWAAVFVFLGLTNGGGTTRIVFLVAAALCLISGLYFIRSFAFVQGKEF